MCNVMERTEVASLRQKACQNALLFEANPDISKGNAQLDPSFSEANSIEWCRKNSSSVFNSDDIELDRKFPLCCSSFFKLLSIVIMFWSSSHPDCQSFSLRGLSPIQTSHTSHCSSSLGFVCLGHQGMVEELNLLSLFHWECFNQLSWG